MQRCRSPRRRAGNCESPTTIRAEAVRLYRQLMTNSRTQMLPGGNWRDRNTVRRQVLGSAANETPVYHHAELILDTFRYVKPMKLSVKKLRQAAAKLPRAGDHTSRRIQYSLQLVWRDLRRRLRSRQSKAAVLRRTSNIFGDRCFAAAGPRLWTGWPQVWGEKNSRTFRGHSSTFSRPISATFYCDVGILKVIA